MMIGDDLQVFDPRVTLEDMAIDQRHPHAAALLKCINKIYRYIL